MGLETDVITDLAVVMIIASVVTLVFHKFKQPIVLGYLLSGIIIGPYTPPFSLVKHIDILNVFAQLGVILLLFGIGLEFPVQKLRSVGRAALGISAAEITATLAVSWTVGNLLGWNIFDTLFLGVALASSSTTIIAKVLSDMGKIEELSSRIMLGVLIIEDIVVVILLAALGSFINAGTLSPNTLLLMLSEVTVFIGGSLLIGGRVIPRVIDRVAKLKNGELLHIVLLGFCFGFSVIAYLIGFSIAIGAFIIGVVISQAHSAPRENIHFAPLKEMFGALFFVSMGALMDVSQLTIYWLPALIVTMTLLVTKLASCAIGTKLFRYDSRTSLRVGLGMAQIGEFAFISIRTGQDLGVVGSFLLPVVGVAAIMTSFATPYLIRIGYRQPKQVS
jgi:CPA2 family monovalent cation:H+ antiporter-2